jgi:hypothetical protein
MTVTREQLDKVIGDAIRDTFKPPILIGPKWLRDRSQGAPTDFQFIGMPKIAKATSNNLRGIAVFLLKKMDVASLGLRYELLDDGTVNFTDLKSAKPPTTEKK